MIYNKKNVTFTNSSSVKGGELVIANNVSSRPLSESEVNEIIAKNKEDLDNITDINDSLTNVLAEMIGGINEEYVGDYAEELGEVLDQIGETEDEGLNKIKEAINNLFIGSDDSSSDDSSNADDSSEDV